MRLIDADKLPLNKIDDANYGSNYIRTAPTVEAIPKDQIQKAIDKVEEYICDIETDTVKAQGMAQALDIFEQTLKENDK